MNSYLLITFLAIYVISLPVSSRILYKRHFGFVDHTDPGHEHFKRASDDSKTATIKKVKGIYLCGSDLNCESIPEYDIAKNESFSCYDRNLAIQFFTNTYDETIKVNKKSPTHGFLKKDKPFLVNNQQTSKVCYQIKR